jgi:hypothetical protein
MKRAITTLLAAVSLAAAAAPTGVETGRYEGTAFNTTAGKGGKLVLEITTVDGDKVQARFAASEGLSGEGWLAGTVAGGTLQLAGQLSSWHMTLTASARPGGALAGTYELEGQGSQQGRFEVTRRGASSPVLAAGEPPLTGEMAARFVDLYDRLLELRLDAAQQQRLTDLLAGAWRRGDRAVIDDVLADLEQTSGKTMDAFEAGYGPDDRLAVAESARRNGPRDLVLAALVAAYDQAHPDRIAATRAKGFADLVGMWKRGDALAPQRNPFTGAPAGVSFSEAESLQFGADHRFIRALYHEHCGGTGVRCCTTYRLGWQGTADVEGGQLALHISAGLELMSDSCRPGWVQREEVKPRVERLDWSMSPDRKRGDRPRLCWQAKHQQPVCSLKGD